MLCEIDPTGLNNFASKVCIINLISNVKIETNILRILRWKLTQLDLVWIETTLHDCVEVQFVMFPKDEKPHKMNSLMYGNQKSSKECNSCRFQSSPI